MLKCAQRELALRERVYPQFVGAKRMTQFKAEEELAGMKEIVAHFRGLLR